MFELEFGYLIVRLPIWISYFLLALVGVLVIIAFIIKDKPGKKPPPPEV